MTGFEPGSSGIGSDRSANCATTTAQRSNVEVFKGSTKRDKKLKMQKASFRERVLNGQEKQCRGQKIIFIRYLLLRHNMSVNDVRMPD